LSSVPRRSLLIAAFAIVSIVWGSTYLGIRVALESYPPFFLGAARFLVAGLVLVAVARARGEPMPARREWGSAGVTGILFFVVGNGLVNLAERSVSSGLASVLVATMPLWMTELGRIFGAQTLRAGLALAYLCVFGSLVGFTAYSYLLRHTRPAVATSYAYVNPVIAVVLGIVMASEKFGLESGAGALVVLAAVALVQKRAGARASQPEADDRSRDSKSPSDLAPAGGQSR
jgi:drug/metabolite transporter (DMT)-like permease